MISIVSGTDGSVLAYEIDEMAVHTAVGGELGMESGGEDVSLLDQDGEAVALGEDVDTGSGLHDARGTNVDELHGAAFELCWRSLNGAVDLASVGVAFDGDVEDGEALLRRIRHFFGEEDTAGAGAEGGACANEGLKAAEESVSLEEFEKGGRFAAGDDESVDAVELLGLADEDRFGAGFAQRRGMSIEVALDGEDTYLGYVDRYRQFQHSNDLYGSK